MVPLDRTCVSDNLECYNCGVFRPISTGGLTSPPVSVEPESWGRIKAAYR